MQRKPLRPGTKLHAAIQKRDLAQDRIVAQNLAILDAYFARVTERVIREIHDSRRVPENVNLSGIRELLDNFYVEVIGEGLNIAREEDPGRGPSPAKLARLPKANLPKNIKTVQGLFGYRSAFKTLMNRSERLSNGLKKAYLGRLRSAFQIVVPAVLSNEISITEVQKKIAEVWDATKSRAALIFRMESTKYFSETQVAYYKGHPRIIGFLYDTIKDFARTDICRSRHGLIYRPDTKLLKDNTPPNHFGCRAHLIPLADISYNRKMLAEDNRDPEIRKVVPLPRNWRKSA